MLDTRSLSAAVLVLSTLAVPSGAEVARTLEQELPPLNGRFAVENLIGSMRIRQGSGANVKVKATVHAESQEIADQVQLVTVTGKDGRTTLRVRYPLSRSREIRSLHGERSGGGDWFGWGGHSGTEYDGYRVRIGGRGMVVYADLEVEAPAGRIDGVFRNLYGSSDAEGLSGRILIDSASGPLKLVGMSGDVVADTGSGDVTAERLSGRFKCDTGSGDCAVNGFEGDLLTCDTGSGAVTIRDVQAGRVSLDTGSGRIQAFTTDTQSFEADAGSGDVELETTGSRLTRVTADTGSGDVILRIDPGTGFDLRADTGSGDIRSDFRDAEAVREDDEIVGYRRGDRALRIQVDTGSGNVRLTPAR